MSHTLYDKSVSSGTVTDAALVFKMATFEVSLCDFDSTQNVFGYLRSFRVIKPRGTLSTQSVFGRTSNDLKCSASSDGHFVRIPHGIVYRR